MHRGIVVALALALSACGSDAPPASGAGKDAKQVVTEGFRIETAHYTIGSTATPAQTEQTGRAMEQLHAAWRARFAHLPQATPNAKLQVRLYGTRAEFKAYNTRVPWAEAMYVPPECRAYVGDGANPWHWMLHEGAHQLAREVMGFKRARWGDEGLASYFGSSRVDDAGLHTGTFDPNAYPIWWLPQFRFSGDVVADARDGRIIPLRALIEDTGPPHAAYVNLYYIEYWSLAHFLLHGEGGRHARGFERLLANGARLADFEREIGPVEQVQAAWYAHLLALRSEVLRTTPG